MYVCAYIGNNFLAKFFGEYVHIGTVQLHSQKSYESLGKNVNFEAECEGEVINLNAKMKNLNFSENNILTFLKEGAIFFEATSKGPFQAWELIDLSMMIFAVCAYG
jgi:hypothetical protein